MTKLEKAALMAFEHIAAIASDYEHWQQMSAGDTQEVLAIARAALLDLRAVAEREQGAKEKSPHRSEG